MCFFLVLALYLLIHERLFLAGVGDRDGRDAQGDRACVLAGGSRLRARPPRRRAAAILALPSRGRLRSLAGLRERDRPRPSACATMGRWLGSADGRQDRGPAHPCRPADLGERSSSRGSSDRCMIFAAGATARARRDLAPSRPADRASFRSPTSSWRSPSSFVIRLKEPRFLIAIVPMIALVHRAARRLGRGLGGDAQARRRRGPMEPDQPAASRRRLTGEVISRYTPPSVR